ncbi:AAA family ATPase [Alteribacillus sp. HJP-4]|uniref:AAA family ATPase n=1 Tax=Alteribacillus sp. HJP-4 TaxID=2775394 RepID=UPI0035CCCEAD
MKRIYIISGPAGAGKSTTAKMLAESLPQSAYIEGDVVNHMVESGYLPPWESSEQLALTWQNIAGLAVQFLQADYEVVIDYVAFPQEVKRFSSFVVDAVENVEIIYVVLWADNEVLLQRDAQREPDLQMGSRCLELVEELTASGVPDRFYFETSLITSEDIPFMLEKIKTSPDFVYLSYQAFL